MKDQIALKQQKKLDNILNKTLIDLGVFSLVGYVAGIAVGIFFKNKHIAKNLMAGVGGSYAIVSNQNRINTLV